MNKVLKKHAYLFLVHNNIEQLKILLKLIDDERNDIFIHIDKKSDMKKLIIESYVKKSSIFFCDSINVYWGHISITQATYSLIELAISKNKYWYYHLLSGADLPLKTQDEIHSFFEESRKEFVHFSPNEITKNNENRYKFYWLGIKYYKINNIKSMIIKFIRKVFLLAQTIIGYNRLSNSNINVIQGCAWWSITDDFARYVVSKKEWVLRHFKYTLIPDETFVQTLLKDSPFLNNINRDYNHNVYDNHEACLRKIDWSRGNPYVWQIEDYDELINSNCIFARKFDINIDKQIIDKIYNQLINKN